MTKEQQIKIQRCIDEFYSNRPQVRDELGVALQVLYEAVPIKHGRRINEQLASTSGGSYSVVRCSVCKAQFPMYKTHYCPNCGAKMDEVKNG